MKPSLPNVGLPSLVTTLPISQKTVSYRPFVIKEQKALLLAQDSGDERTIVSTIKSVIDSCSGGTLDFSQIPVADLAYFFIQLRIASVGPEVKFIVKCERCEKEIPVEMSLTDIKIDTSSLNLDVNVTPTVGIRFKLPTVEDTLIPETAENRVIELLLNMIDYIYDADQVYKISDYSKEEFREWVEGLNETQIQEIIKFTESIPDISHNLAFTCPHCQHKQSRLLEGLHSFFRFGVDS